MSTKQIFEKFDKNKNGKLSLDEFHEAAFAFSKKISHEEIVKMFEEIDVDGDGKFGVDEFTFYIEKMLKEVFVFCDADGDGKIPANELYVTMIGLGKECSEEICAEMVRTAEADGDGYGYLTFEEFMAMLFSDFYERVN